MSQAFKAKKSAVAIIALLMTCAALAAVVMADNSSAASDVSIGSVSVPSSFTEGQNVTVNFNVSNNSGLEVTVTVQALENGNVKGGPISFDMAPGESCQKSISFSLGSGDHSILINGSAIDRNTGNAVNVTNPSSTVNVHVDKGFWSDWVPYAAIIVVAIIIAIMIYIWYRGRPNSKPAVTFNDLEEGKVPATATASDTSRKKYESVPSTEEKSSGRMKYVSDRRK